MNLTNSYAWTSSFTYEQAPNDFFYKHKVGLSKIEMKTLPANQV